MLASNALNSKIDIKSAMNPVQSTQNKLNFISSYNRMEKTQFTTPSKLTQNPNANSASQNMFQSLYQIKQTLWDSPSNQKNLNEPRTPKSYLN